MKKISILFSILLASTISTNVWAQEYESLEGLYYEDIISELSVQRTPQIRERSLLDEVKIHLGLSFVNSLFTLNSPEGKSISTSTRGLQFGLGIDLLSEQWIAEGTIKSYGETYEEEGTISASEFDLRIAYVNPLAKMIKMRFGTGIGARYLDVQWSNGQAVEYQTPVSIFFTGADLYITERLSLGGDISARTPMTDETPDSTAIEIAFKLDGHF